MTKNEPGWNFFFTGYGTQPALGALATMQFFTPPNANYKPAEGKDDPDLIKAWDDMNNLPDPKDRQAAFVAHAETHPGQGLRDPVRFADQGAGRAGERAGIQVVPDSAYVQRVVHEMSRG